MYVRIGYMNRPDYIIYKYFKTGSHTGYFTISTHQDYTVLYIVTLLSLCTLRGHDKSDDKTV